MEKGLVRLDGLDKTVFGDGVLIDIDTHRITIALQGKEQIPLRAIYDRIKKGGYRPVTLHLRLRGRVEIEGDTRRLKTEPSGQVFILQGEKRSAINDGEEVDIQVHLDARNIPSVKDSDSFEVVIDKIYGPAENG